MSPFEQNKITQAARGLSVAVMMAVLLFASSLASAAAQGETGPDATDETRIGERSAYVGDRRLRQTEAAGDLARSRGFAVVVRENVEDRRRAGDRGGERVRFRGRGCVIPCVRIHGHWGDRPPRCTLLGQPAHSQTLVL